MNGTAAEIAKAIEVGSVGMLFTTDSKRLAIHRGVVEMMTSRLKQQAKREGLTADDVDVLLSEVDDAVAKVKREFIDDRN